MNETIITVAPTGAWPTKKNNPNIPLTPSEIAEQVYDAYNAGASIAHLHMRDSESKGTMAVNLFEETVNLIRSKCDIILNLTTSGDLEATWEKRQEHLALLKPDLASFDAGTMNWMNNSIFENHPKFLEELGQTMIENEVKPEIEVFDTSFIYNAKYYEKKGFLKTPLHFQFVLGAAGGIPATVENLVFLKNHLPEKATWGALGVGKSHIPIMLATLSMGGHLRVGMEDNVYYSEGKLAESNAQLVERAAKLVVASDGKVATVSDARRILSLPN